MGNLHRVHFVCACEDIAINPKRPQTISGKKYALVI